MRKKRTLIALAGAAATVAFMAAPVAAHASASPSPAGTDQVITQADGNPNQPAPPGAADTTSLPGAVSSIPDLSNGYYWVLSPYDGDYLAYSIPSNLWYDAETNMTGVETGGGGTWQEIHNANSPGYCWTEDFAGGGVTNIIQDKSPCASKASQLFQIIDGGGNPIAWHIQNEYMNDSQSHICGAAHGDQPTVVTTPGVNQPVFMGCPEDAPYLTINQTWNLPSDSGA